MSKAIDSLKRFEIHVGSAPIFGEEAGSGEALIFLHAGVCDKRMWRAQLAHLSSQYHCIAYDCRGSGETATIQEPFSLIDDLAAIIDHFGLERVSLIGCSMGGGIAICFALAHPERVRSLVVIAPGIPGQPESESFPPEVDVLVAELESLDIDKENDIVRINEIETHIWLDGPTSPWNRVSDTALRELFLDMNGIQLRAPRMPNMIKPPNVWERLAELTMPTFVLVGDKDFPDLQDVCLHLSQVLLDVRYHEIADVAHIPSLEKPELVSELLQTFFDDVLSGGVDAG